VHWLFRFAQFLTADACSSCFSLFLGAITLFESKHYGLKKQVLMVKKQVLMVEKASFDGIK
jgi:hypothetical protein